MTVTQNKQYNVKREICGRDDDVILLSWRVM